MSDYSLEGVVLRRIPRGESALAVNLCTRERGKVQLVSKSARLQKGKLKGLIEPGLWVQVDAHVGKFGDTLTGSVIQAPFLAWRQSVEGVAAAHVFLEVIDKLTLEGENAGRTFELLCLALCNVERHCAAGKIARLPLDILWFQMNFLSWLGLEPETGRCVECSKNLRRGEAKVFDLRRGGVLHRTCAGASGCAVSVTDATLKFMRFVLFDQRSEDFAQGAATNLRRLERLEMKEAEVWRAAELLEKFMIFNTEIQLRAGKVARDLLRGT